MSVSWRLRGHNRNMNLITTQVDSDENPCFKKDPRVVCEKLTNTQLVVCSVIRLALTPVVTYFVDTRAVYWTAGQGCVLTLGEMVYKEHIGQYMWIYSKENQTGSILKIDR